MSTKLHALKPPNLLNLSHYLTDFAFPKANCACENLEKFQEFYEKYDNILTRLARLASPFKKLLTDLESTAITKSRNLPTNKKYMENAYFQCNQNNEVSKKIGSYRCVTGG